MTFLDFHLKAIATRWKISVIREQGAHEQKVGKNLQLANYHYSLLRGSDGERGSNAPCDGASARLETSPSTRFTTHYSLSNDQ